MRGTAIRNLRTTAGISGALLCLKTGISRSRLSEIERGYCHPDSQELEQINTALTELRAAKQQIQHFAASVGWPVAEVDQ